MKLKIAKRLGIVAAFLLCGVLFCCKNKADTSLVLEDAQTGEQADTKEDALRDEENEAGEQTGEKAEQKESSETVCVYVCGAVVNPGVYVLSSDSRKYQAIEMAGGMTAEAAEGAVNLAEQLIDGEQLRIPSKGEVLSDEEAAKQEEAGENGKININRADKDQLMNLPGIGEGKAEAIIAYREAHNGFSSTEELMQVEGIKQGTYEKLKDKICI